MTLQRILNIQNLNFGYLSDKLIYKNFTLTLNVGEIISIVGLSGSGKSTLFELITNNLKPFRGIIEASKMSSIYQDSYTSFHPTITIISQIKDIAGSLNQLIAHDVHLAEWCSNRFIHLNEGNNNE